MKEISTDDLIKEIFFFKGDFRKIGSHSLVGRDKNLLKGSLADKNFRI